MTKILPILHLEEEVEEEGVVNVFPCTLQSGLKRGFDVKGDGRIAARKHVNWHLFCVHFKAGRKSIIKTFILATFAPLVMLMGLCYICWGTEEMKETERKFALILDCSPTFLRIPVLLTASTFILGLFLMILGIHFRQRLILFGCVGTLVVSLGIEIFTITRMVIRSSSSYLKSFLEEHLSSFIEQDVGKHGSKCNLMNKIQREFSCCGVSTYKDWFTINACNQSRELPKSCCQFPILSEKDRKCYDTNNNSDPTCWALSRKGCLEPIQKYLAMDDRLKWVYIGAGLITISLTIAILLCYTLPKWPRGRPLTLKYVKPDIHTLILQLVDEFILKLFGEDDKLSPTLTDYVKIQIDQCTHLESVPSLLTTLNDTLYYVKYPRPPDLAQLILRGKPGLVSKFEREMRKIRNEVKKGDSSEDGHTLIDFVPQVPRNSVQELPESSPSASVPLIETLKKESKNRRISAIVVPHELKQRMKNVEKFLQAYNDKENRLRKEHYSLERVHGPVDMIMSKPPSVSSLPNGFG